MLYEFVKGLLKVFVSLWFKWEVVGGENLPNQGPVVVAANHASMWDPVMVGIALPRKVHYMAKKELFRIPLFGQVLHPLGAFPVKRGKSDRAALKAAIEVLKEGKVLGLFPEGSRTKDGALMEFQPGAGLLALKGNAPLVPIAIKGTFKMGLRFKRKVFVVIGDPIYLDDFKESARINSKELARAMGVVRNNIHKMMNERT